MSEPVESCVKPAKGPISGKQPEAETGALAAQSRQEGIGMKARVGKPAPDFEASAYLKGGFRNVSLSEFKGSWVVLCFYPGDFTFV